MFILSENNFKSGLYAIGDIKLLYESYLSLFLQEKNSKRFSNSFYPDFATNITSWLYIKPKMWFEN